MVEWASLIIGGLAVVLALIALPGFSSVRLVGCLLALGCGQIHLAVLAFGILLVIDNGWQISRPAGLPALTWGGLLIVGILFTTAMNPYWSRTFYELAQLALYVILLVLMLSYLKTGEDLLRFLTCAVIAALLVALLALGSVMLGLQSPPHIFLGRGSNEGAVFLSLTGVVPAAVLFVRSRNPLYLLAALFLLYAQYVSTSRGSIVVSLMTLLLAFFFMFHNRLVRAALIAAGLYVLTSNLPVISNIYQGQLNFSARERLGLLEYGYWLWEQRPLLGWGWGSTTDLAPRAPSTALQYPHFHNSYVQLLVEGGIVGVLIIGTFAYFCIRSGIAAATKIRQPAVTMLVVSVGLSLAVSGVFDAMIYGADRTLQVIILLALAARAVVLAPPPDITIPSGLLLPPVWPPAARV